MLGGYHHWHSQDDNSTAPRELTNKKGKLLMGSVSYSAHISNGKSAITSKSKLAGVAKHNLRKYKSGEYSSENVELIFGTKDLYQDVQKVYYEEFDEIVREYNEKQTRADRRIDNYFEHVAKLDQDMAVEIIFQCGDKNFWEEHTDNKDRMYYVFSFMLSQLQEQLPDFKVANAVIHFDEASPHMHVVGVPVGYGAKRGLPKKVSKRNVFTPETLSTILQGSLRKEAEKCFKFNIKEEFGEKKKGRNHDLSVVEYKVAKETKHLSEVQEQAKDAEIHVFASKLAGKEIIRIAKDNAKSINEEIQKKVEQRDDLDFAIDIRESTIQEYDENIRKLENFLNSITELKRYITSYLPYLPLIEEYSNSVEQGKDIQAGNNFRGLLLAIGELLKSFKELIVDGICWFPRLMRWNTSKGEVTPIFNDYKNEGYDYRLKAYMNVATKERYSIESIQSEIKAENRIGTLEQLEQGIEVTEKLAKEIQLGQKNYIR